MPEKLRMISRAKGQNVRRGEGVGRPWERLLALAVLQQEQLQASAKRTKISVVRQTRKSENTPAWALRQAQQLAEAQLAKALLTCTGPRPSRTPP